MAGLIRLFLIEDHRVVLQGLAEMLQREPGMTVVGTATDTSEAVDAIERVRPDVAVSDVMFGDDPRGLALPATLRDRGLGSVAVLFLSSFESLWFHRSAVDAGARGYLLKSVPLAELVAAIRVISDGGTAFPAEALRPPMPRERTPSPREREVLDLVASGAGNGEIATALGISDRTVESHLARLFERYEVSSRTELVVLGLERGWLRRPAERSRPLGASSGPS